jgi:thymidylate synthase
MLKSRQSSVKARRERQHEVITRSGCNNGSISARREFDGEKMKEICYPTLGETWLAALREVERAGESVGGETRELLHLGVSFQRAAFDEDPLLARFGSAEQVEQMRKVFFSDEPNRFGHSYRDRLRGPEGRSDLSDVVALLRRDAFSKRAVVTLAVPGDGTVPCINAVQFLCRRDGLAATYFSRGQDMFHKFYADGVCLFEMARHVAAGLETPLRSVTGFIASAHVYTKDLADIHALLARVDALACSAAASGGAA